MKKALLVGLIAVAIMPIQVGAYGVETHAAITQEIARFYNQFYPDHAFTQAEMKTLMVGAVDEDDSLRFLNHFYDPVHKVGLTFGAQNMTSKSWAQDSVAQAGIVNNGLALVLSPDDYNSTDFTWKRAVEDYARGKTERGLEGLGHVLHLIEDLTVPAHVRNDPHPPKGSVGEKLGDDDPYELWSHKFTPYKTNILIHMLDKKPIAGLGSLNKYFDELATYTNSRFFSKDTINSGGFSLPKLDVLSEESSGKSSLFRNQEGALVAVGISSPFNGIVTNTTTDDERVSQSTWDRLSVKAVQYGAGVVDLFFSEVEKLKKDPNFNAAEKKSLLGQFIDSVGENVDALIKGAPTPQPAVLVQVPKPIIEESAGALAPVAKAVVTPVPVSPVPVAQPSPAPVVPTPQAARVLSGSSGGDDESSESEEEPVVEPEVEPAVEESEPIIEPEPEPEPIIVVPEVDIAAPAGVSSLEARAVSEQAIELTWIAPGDDGDFGTATSYELRYALSPIMEPSWLTATLAAGLSAPAVARASELFEVSGLTPMTMYYFALKAKDEAGNESAISNIVSATTRIAKSSHIVISEISPDMVGADTSEFVELYNPTDAPINISGYSLQYLSGTAAVLTGATKKNFVPGATVPAKGFYSIGMFGNPTADMVWSESLNNTGATVFLVNDQVAVASLSDENIVDKVSYGSGPGLVSPEGVGVLLPGEGKSLERRALTDGVCVAATGNAEFFGNGCDTGNNSVDFDIRTTPKAQRLTSLIEPRTPPAAVSNTPAVLAYNAANAQLVFNWTAPLDVSGGSSGMSYKIMDTNDAATPVQLYLGTALSFAKTIDEIGREYKATIQAFDKDGMPSALTDMALQAPGYLKELKFYKDPASASGSPAYLVRIAWDTYPFVPVGTGQWHLAVFYYNKDAEKIPFLGQLNSGYGWGMGLDPKSSFKTEYKNCFGGSFTTYNSASLILPDDAAHCSGLSGNIKASAIDFGLLRDKVLTLPVLPSTFGGTTPTSGQDYITVAYYFHVVGNPLGLDQRLIAVDKTRYYLSE